MRRMQACIDECQPNTSQANYSEQGSKFKFEFGSTCATRCKFLGTQLKILGAQLIVLGASISKEKVKRLTVPRLFVIFSL